MVRFIREIQSPDKPVLVLLHNSNHDVWWLVTSEGPATRFDALTHCMELTKWHINMKPGSDSTSAAYDPVNNLLILAQPTIDCITAIEPHRDSCGKQLKDIEQTEISMAKYPNRDLIVVNHVENRLVLIGCESFDVITLSSMEHHLKVWYNNTHAAYWHDAAYDAYNNRIVTKANACLTSFSAATGDMLHTSGVILCFYSQSICVDNRGRIIMLAANEFCQFFLSAYTSDLQLIATESVNTDGVFPQGIALVGGTCVTPKGFIAFDSLRGNIGFVLSDGKTCCCWLIPANTWLPNTYEWTVNKHRYAPRNVREVVNEVTNIRSLVPESPLALMPNELLFLIFEHL